MTNLEKPGEQILGAYNEIADKSEQLREVVQTLGAVQAKQEQYNKELLELQEFQKGLGSVKVVDGKIEATGDMAALLKDILELNPSLEEGIKANLLERQGKIG